ncbi:MAG: hypothetical protein PHD51_00730 [Patescibacteria group bacterium]|nr:hypothetical protein [Patescibacteria group bacterium]MDD5490608.1 hypothetical protein [Patescibacteria group bacterium]
MKWLIILAALVGIILGAGEEKEQKINNEQPPIVCRDNFAIIPEQPVIVSPTSSSKDKRSRDGRSNSLRNGPPSAGNICRHLRWRDIYPA